MTDEARPESPRRRPRGLRFSLIEAFAILLYACVGIAAAKTGGVIAWLFAEATIVLVVGFLVAAIFCRGRARAFAIGFVIAAGAHAGLLAYFGASEFDPSAARLPFSKIVAPLWSALEPERFVSSSDGREVSRSDVTTSYASDADGRMHVFYQTADGSSVARVERPPREEFMLVAHSLGAVAGGYALGKLAEALHRRRVARTVDEPAPPFHPSADA